MSAVPQITRLPQATRLRLWVFASLCILLAGPTIFRIFAHEQAAYSVQVPDALNRPSQTEWFGTDSLGRSQWHRTLLGLSVSLRTVGGAIVLALPLSVLLGAIAGSMIGRWPDRAISWVVALLHTIPFFLLVVAVAALAGPGTNLLPWLVGGVIWAPAARLVRVETIRILNSGYVRASQAAGASPVQIFSRCLLPQITPPAAVCLFYLFPEIIGIDAILTLFGLGPQPPTPSLGTLIFEGLRRWESAPWLAGLPCVLVMVLCLFIHFLADRIAAQLNRSA